MPSYVDVAVPVGVRKTFAYSVPVGLRNRIAVGMRVLVPFGRKVLTGFVVRTLEQSPIGEYKLRRVQELLDPQPAIAESLVKTALWVAEYYFAPPGEVFRALFPAGTQISGSQQVRLSPKAAAIIGGGLLPPGLKRQQNVLLQLLSEGPVTVTELANRSGIRNLEGWLESLISQGWVCLSTELEKARVRTKQQLTIRALAAEQETIGRLTAVQKRLYEFVLSSVAPPVLQDALRASCSTLSVARALQRKGMVAIEPARVERVPAELSLRGQVTVPKLTGAQQRIADEILEMIVSMKSARCLIHGVTGSGKTEIYLKLIAEVVKRDWSALFLVPEIGLTPMLTRLVSSRFPDQVSLLHSGMSPGERIDQWNRIREGRSRIVVGTRSAVFAPLTNLRLAVIDEEQDSSYKQDESPCYHAREVAWHRVQQSNGVLVMGSATPSIETFYGATDKGEIRYFVLPERIEAKPMPQVTIVDMAVEFQRHGKTQIISQTLEEELRSCMQRGEQAIVLLNRRGYSRSLLCRSCGHVVGCPECSVSMVYHQKENRLTCHYCGREREVPSRCLNCNGTYIYYVGVGTEQLEAILRQLLPAARIARLDRDVARKRGALRSALYDFANRKLDLLVGTQILAKGHDFPDVTLVGVVAADSGLSFPDFRAAERTFQLLTQVAGRAGRGTLPGRVVFQSFYPNNYALLFAARQDYRGFYEQEIEFRRLMGYPPFMKLVQVVVSDSDADKAVRQAEKIAGILREQMSKLDDNTRPRLLGPAPAPLEKLRGKYRMQILLKWPPESNPASFLLDCFSDLSRRRISSAKVHIDVDPLSLL